jgi:hypothetical protein
MAVIPYSAFHIKKPEPPQRLTDRQTDRQTGRQKDDRRAGRQTDRQTDSQTDRQTNKQTYRQTGIEKAGRQTHQSHTTDTQTDR